MIVLRRARILVSIVPGRVLLGRIPDPYSPSTLSDEKGTEFHSMVRLKARYVCCQVLSGPVGGAYNTTPVTAREVTQKVSEIVGENHGSFGQAHDCKVVYFDPPSGVLCLRTNRDFEKQLHFALTCISSLKGNTPALVRCLHISGSMRTCLVALWETLAKHVEMRGDLGGSAEVRAEKQRYLTEIRTSFT